MTHLHLFIFFTFSHFVDAFILNWMRAVTGNLASARRQREV